MVVQVEFHSLIGGTNCINSGAAAAAPPPKVKPSENLVNASMLLDLK